MMTREENLRIIRARCYFTLVGVILGIAIGGYLLNDYRRSHELTFEQLEFLRDVEAVCSVIFMLSMFALGGVETFAEWWRNRERRRTDPYFRFFISYTTREPEVAEFQLFIDEFVEAVQNRYLKKTVFYDRFTLEKADRTDYQLRCELTHALQRSGFMIAFISPEYPKSNWCMYEWESAQQILPNRILPIKWKHPSNKDALPHFPDDVLGDAVDLAAQSSKSFER